MVSSAPVSASTDRAAPRPTRNLQAGVAPTRKALFATVLEAPVPPSLVADKILEIAVGDTDQPRHLAGPNAAPFLGWRRAMSDEAWVALGTLDDDAWYARMEADFGIDARPQAQA